MKLVLVFIFAYLLGATPNGYIFGMKFAGKDIRNYGSGNVGATNVARVAGYKVGLLVAILDIAKGYVAVLMAQYLLLPEYSMGFVFAAVLLAVIGHNWSIFLSFNGGKGVATSVGIILRLFPYSLLVLFIVWIIMIIITKMVSVGSILGAISLPFSVALIYSTDTSYLIFSTIITLLIIFSHRSNIKRLINGNENKMSWPPGKEG
ncbi:MAG TPA: glycerol-3-phosphate 1-O-acyltransferase PlsY [Halanaerobiales bacterium]|nr:glycerol-3-phosphate 1-O-acyltransferase PlsY [Halanaerobiales bacterium]